ncbi:MAG: hypothetical protein U0Z17_06365 [Bacteroidales bacterium]
MTTDELEDLLRATGVLPLKTAEQVKRRIKIWGYKYPLPDELKDSEAFFKGLLKK